MNLLKRGCLIVLLLLTGLSSGKAQEPLTVRLGVVTYEDLQDEDGELQALLERLSGSQNPPVRFQIAAGSYREVTHWLRIGEIDVALLTAGGYVRSILQSGIADEFELLATMDAGPGVGPWVNEQRQSTDFQRFYHSCCIVHQSHQDLTAEKLKALIEAGQLEVYFVHPQSASGCLIPLLALHEMGIEVPVDSIHYMHSHSQVLEQLVAQAGNKKAIGFVWDDAISKLPNLESELVRLELPALDKTKIPHDVLIAHKSYSQLDAFKQLLQSQAFSQAQPLFLPPSTGNQEYVALQTQLDSITELQNDLLVRQDLEGVGQLLAHAQKNATEHQPFRLAVVLSGGGARCAYQVGAISVVEDYLKKLNAEYGADLNVDLVVGTSGGALNAVPVSMEVSTYETGQAVWSDVWTSLDQREIIKPSLAVCINAGIWFAFLQMTGVYLFSRVFRRQYVTRLNFFYRACLLLGAVEFILWFVPFEPWALLGHNHLLHHLWLWCQLGAEYTALTLLFCGAIYFFVARVAANPSRQELKIRRGRIHWVLTVGVLGLPLLQLITMFINEQTFSTGDGIRESLVNGYSTMLEEHAHQQGLDFQIDQTATTQQRLEAMGEWIVQNNSLKRDLVLTTTAIERSRPDIPSELYFYLQADDDSPQPEFGNRGIDMSKSPQQFMKVVLGSSAIYPAFPGQIVKDIPESGDVLELVDGGFAHNAPVEAAVLWGASHVLLVDVSPLALRDSANLADSVIRGFGHLLRQSQLSDERSRSEVVVMNLQPRFEPPLCIIDFSSNLIGNGIRHGRQDASTKTRLENHDGVEVELPPFVVSYGKPEFLELLSPVRLEVSIELDSDEDSVQTESNSSRQP